MAITYYGAVPDKSDHISNPYDSAFDGTRFEQMARNNPYLNYNYELGLWDRIGNTFGFRTNEDKVREQMEQASRDYNAQLYQLQSEDQYNSPSEQANRMRQAGMNPDLLGTDSVAPAGEFAQEQTSPDLSSNDNTQVLSTASNILWQTVNGGFSIAEGLFNIENIQLDQFTKIRDIASGIMNDVSSLGGNLDQLKANPRTGDVYTDLLTNGDASYNPYGHLPFRPKTISKVQDMFPLVRNSIYRKSGYYKQANDMVTFRNGANDGNARFADSDGKGGSILDQQDRVLQIIVEGQQKFQKEIFDFNLSALKNQLKYDADYFMNARGSTAANAFNNENAYNSAYFGGLNGTLAAEAQNTQAENTTKEIRAKIDLNKGLRDIYSKLSAESAKGNKWATASLIALSIAMQNNMPNFMPSFTRSKGPKGVTTSFGF